LRLAAHLGKLGVVDHALRDAVRPAEPELLGTLEEIGVALDAVRLGHEVLGAPVVGGHRFAAEQFGPRG
jgi:hypothetical protein